MQFRKGQRVKIEVEGTYVDDTDNDWTDTRLVDVRLDLDGDTGIWSVRPELLTALPDDPSTDPIGTVREDGGYLYIKTDTERADTPWVLIAKKPLARGWTNFNSNMVGSKIIGSIKDLKAA